MPTIKASLNPTEARVIGALIEKAITTPDQYPLSLNALVNACNQKSNRDPVLNLDEQTVQSTLDALKKRFLVSEASGYGSRVTKYQHRFCNSAFGGLQLSPAELAILCELLLRGPQTPGELRSHGERLHAFSGSDEVESSLTRLAEREEPLVEKLPREPGKREARYRHLFTATTEEAVSPVHAVPPPQLKTENDRLNLLEQEVQALRAEIASLKQRLDSRTA
jgi:uncharacterized protein YceH (UPF0502 family)